MNISINMEILYENLIQYGPSDYKSKNLDEFLCLGIYYVSDNKSYIKNYVLIGQADSFTKDMRGFGIISSGMVNEELLKYNKVICFSDEISAEKLYEESERLMLKLKEWSYKMQQALDNAKPLQYMLEITKPIIENPIIFHDEYYKLIAYAGEVDWSLGWNYDEEKKAYTIKYNVLSDFKINEDFKIAMEKKEPTIFSKEMFGFRGLFMNVLVNGNNQGRLVINEIERNLKKLDYYVLEQLSKYLVYAIKMGNFITTSFSENINNVFISLLQGNKIKESYVSSVLAQKNWNINDKYICVRLKTETRDIYINTIDASCTNLGNSFTSACIINLKNEIIMIVNISKYTMGINEFTSELAVYIREGLFKAGISRVSNDIMKLRDYYIQADAAYCEGIKKDPSFWIFQFDNYLLSYIFNQSSNELPYNMLYDEKLLILKEYDNLHQTELYRTLKIYLENNINLAKTSEELIIHRSTLISRIERINKLVDFKLDNPKKRFLLLWSYYIEEEYNS